MSYVRSTNLNSTNGNGEEQIYREKVSTPKSSSNRISKWPDRSYLEIIFDFIRSVQNERWLFAFFIMSYVASYWLANITLYRYVTTDPATLMPLRDLGFDIIPESSAKVLYVISDMIPIVLMILSVIFINKWGSRMLLTDIVYKGTLVFLLNNICQAITVVPHSETIDCFAKRIESDGDSSEHDDFGSWILYEPNIFSNCADMMWSGHTAHTLQAFHVIYVLFYPKPWLKPLFLVLYVTLVTCMLAIRYHYSMDIFVASVIVYFAFIDVRPSKYIVNGVGYDTIDGGRAENADTMPGDGVDLENDRFKKSRTKKIVVKL